MVRQRNVTEGKEEGKGREDGSGSGSVGRREIVPLLDTRPSVSVICRHRSECQFGLRSDGGCMNAERGRNGNTYKKRSRGHY